MKPANEESDAQPDWRSLVGDLSGPLGILAVVGTGLFLLAVLYTLYFARAFLVPVVAAAYLSFLLGPVVRYSRRKLGIPNTLAALIVLLGTAGVTGTMIYRLSGPALNWIESAPQRVQQVEEQLRSLTGPMQQVQDAVDDAADSSGGDAASGEEETVQVESESVGRQLFSRAGELLLGLGAAFFLLFFLMASGELFLRKTLSSIPRFGDRRRVVEISRRIERDLSRYLITKSMINVTLGLAVGTSMWLWEMPNPVLWGVLAALLNFMPYVGGVVGVILLAGVGLISFESVGRGMLPALTYLCLNGLEAYVLTPTIMGHRFSMNPVAVFLSVLFWGWIWGVAGALMAVPILTTVVIVCNSIERLAPVARFLQR